MINEEKKESDLNAENEQQISTATDLSPVTEENRFFYQRDKNFIKKSTTKNALSLALLGLILGPFFGVGILFSVAGFFMGLVSNVKSTSKTWAIIIAIIGVVLNVAFIVSLVVTIVVYGFYLPPIEVV